MEGFANEYFDLSRRIKCCFGKDYDQLHDQKFKHTIAEMRQDIKMAKALKRKFFEEDEESRCTP